MSDQTLWLNANEIMLLADRVRNEDRGTEDMPTCSYPLLLKLGSLYVEAVGVPLPIKDDIPIAVSEAEAWLLRSKVQSGDKTAADGQFGVKLLTKIYRALLAFQIDLQLQDADSDGAEMTIDMRNALRRRSGR